MGWETRHRAEDDQSFKNLNNIYVCQSAGKAKTVTADVGVEVGGAAAAAGAEAATAAAWAAASDFCMQRESRIAATRVRGKFSELRTHIGGACLKAIYALKRCRFLCCLCRCQVKGAATDTEGGREGRPDRTDRQQGKQTRLLIKRSSDF